MNIWFRMTHECTSNTFQCDRSPPSFLNKLLALYVSANQGLVTKVCFICIISTFLKSRTSHYMRLDLCQKQTLFNVFDTSGPCLWQQKLIFFDGMLWLFQLFVVREMDILDLFCHVCRNKPRYFKQNHVFFRVLTKCLFNHRVATT